MTSSASSDASTSSSVSSSPPPSRPVNDTGRESQLQEEALPQSCMSAEGGGASSSRLSPKRAPSGAAHAAVSPAAEPECSRAGPLSPLRAAKAQQPPAASQPHSGQLGACEPPEAPRQVRAAPAPAAQQPLRASVENVASTKRSPHRRSGLTDPKLLPKEREHCHETPNPIRLPAPGPTATSTSSPAVPPVGRAANRAAAAPLVKPGPDTSTPGRHTAVRPTCATADRSQPSRAAGASSPAQPRPSPAAAKPTLPAAGAPCVAQPARCDKCDGAHDASRCPHYKRNRDRHPDAQPGRKCILGDVSVPLLLRRGRVISQPGDGSCLFHSLRFGLARMAPTERKVAAVPSTHSLRQQLARWVVANANLRIADTPVHKWVRWDSGVVPQAYAARMARSGWGGGIEMAACSRLMGVNVWVYEKVGRGFERISCFDAPCGGGGGAGGGAPRPADAAGTVHILYQGGVHYDALLPEGAELAAAVAQAAHRPVKASARAGQGGAQARGPPAGPRHWGGHGKPQQRPAAPSVGGWQNGRGSRGVGKRAWGRGRGCGR